MSDPPVTLPSPNTADTAGHTTTNADGPANDDNPVLSAQPASDAIALGKAPSVDLHPAEGADPLSTPARRVDPLLDDTNLDDVIGVLVRTPERKRSLIEETILKARCEDVARRVIRDGGHTSMAALSRELDCAPVTVKRLMATETYRRTYARVSDELLGTIDERISDERLDVLVRGDALQRRALSVLSDCFEIARAHAAAVAVGDATARPQLLKVAVDAAAEVRQVVTARSDTGDSNRTNVSITVNRTQATIIAGAIAESGVDLSDVLSGDFTVAGASNAPAGAASKKES